MLLQSLAASAAGLAVAQAFLVVPGTVEPASGDALEALRAPPMVAESQTLELPCPNCPLQFTNRHGKPKVKTDKASHLELSFTISHDGPVDRLMVNDFELYPSANPFLPFLNAPHLPDHKWEHKKWHDKDFSAEEKARHGSHEPQFTSPRLGFTLSAKTVAHDANRIHEIVAVDLQIIEVGTTMVNGIPNVHISLVKTNGGGLMIARLDTTPSSTLGAGAGDTECTTLLCRWLVLMQEKASLMAKMRPFGHGHCGGHKKGGIVGIAIVGHKDHGEHPHHHHHEDASGSRHGHGHGHGQGHHRSWRQLLRNIVSHILLPVLVGIIAGVSVSLIGMVVGTVIVSVYRFFFRRAHPHQHLHRLPGHTRRRSTHKEPAAVEEKTGLMEQEETQDPPPAYKDEEPKENEV